MIDSHDHPLSRIELMVLARLSTPGGATETEITRSLHQIGSPLAGPALTNSIAAALAALRGRALVEPERAKRAPARSRGRSRTGSKAGTKPRFTLTENGRLALRGAFDLTTTPTWDETRNRIVPQLALGDQPGSEAADAALASTEAMIATLLRRDRTLGESSTVAQLCDQVIARALGMPRGPVTAAGVRAYALAMHCGVGSKTEFENIAARFAPPTGKARSTKPRKSTGKARSAKSRRPTERERLAQQKQHDHELTKLAAEFARKQLQAGIKDKDAMVRALLRHWVSQQDRADDAQQSPTQWSTPLQPLPTMETDDLPSVSRSPLPAALTATANALLTAVREAIPMVGSAGRYGKDNVFVSALWQQLARDQRLPDLSLDHFKRWLVAANRDQLLALARADLIDDMDARLVEDSEIEDLGATFHFVIDHREAALAPRQVQHAR